MTNPTSDTLLGVPEATVSGILTNLNLPAATDARLAIREILNALNTQYKAAYAATPAPVTYTASKSATNIDLNTQRETYTFTVDMAIALPSVIDEPA